MPLSCSVLKGRAHAMLIGLLEHEASTKDVVIFFFKNLFFFAFLITLNDKPQSWKCNILWNHYLKTNFLWASPPPLPDQMECAVAIPPDLCIQKRTKHNLSSITVPGTLKCLDTIGSTAEWMLSFNYHTEMSEDGWLLNPSFQLSTCLLHERCWYCSFCFMYHPCWVHRKNMGTVRYDKYINYRTFQPITL